MTVQSVIVWHFLAAPLGRAAIVVFMATALLLGPPQLRAAESTDLAQAWEHLLVGNVVGARRLFEQVSRQQPDTTAALQARAGLVLLPRYAGRAYDRAAMDRELNTILALVPASEPRLRLILTLQLAQVWAPGVQDSATDSAAQRARALPYYEAVIAADPAGELGAVALIDWGRVLMANDPVANQGVVTARLEKALATRPSHGAQRLLHQALANQYRIAEDWPNTARHLRLWLAEGIESEWLEAQTHFSLGRIYEEHLNQPAEAIVHYDEVASRFAFFHYAGESRLRARRLRDANTGLSKP